MNGFESIEMTWNDNFWRVHRYRTFDPSPDAEFRSNLKIWHWIKGQIAGKPHILWENLWFPVKISPDIGLISVPGHRLISFDPFGSPMHKTGLPARHWESGNEGKRRAVIGYPVGFERAYSTRIYHDLPQCMLFPCIYFQNNWRVGTGHLKWMIRNMHM